MGLLILIIIIQIGNNPKLLSKETKNSLLLIQIIYLVSIIFILHPYLYLESAFYFLICESILLIVNGLINSKL